MARDATSPFGLYADRVEEMMGVGEPLSDVEQMVERAPLSEEHRAALWLIAHSLAERPVWRRALERPPVLTDAGSRPPIPGEV